MPRRLGMPVPAPETTMWLRLTWRRVVNERRCCEQKREQTGPRVHLVCTGHGAGGFACRATAQSAMVTQKQRRAPQCLPSRPCRHGRSYCAHM